MSPHAGELDIRSVLVSDLGLLATLARLRGDRELPEDLAPKVSASLPVANPATARVLEDLGADSLTLVVDLSLAAIAAIRAAVSVPLDIYVGSPDDFGGVVRHHEIPGVGARGGSRVSQVGNAQQPCRGIRAARTWPSSSALLRASARRAEIGLGASTS